MFWLLLTAGLTACATASADSSLTGLVSFVTVTPAAPTMPTLPELPTVLPTSPPVNTPELMSPLLTLTPPASPTLTPTPLPSPSPTHTATPTLSPAAPNMPQLIRPAFRARLNCAGEEARKVEFIWASAAETAAGVSYNFRIKREHGPDDYEPIEAVTITGTSYMPDEKLACDQVYRWEVQAVNEQGNRSTWSYSLFEFAR